MPLTHLLPPEYPALLPATQVALHRWLETLEYRQHPEADPPVNFPYQNLPPSARLTYELVGWPNLPAYLPLFAADPSPFVDAHFKDRAALERYGVSLLTLMRHSFKHGGCDWLARRHADAQPIGVLHLYDLSLENYNGTPPCAVGYAVAAPHRRQGYAREMLTHLLPYAATLFGRTEARAIPETANVASRELLRSAGFRVLEERPTVGREAATELWGSQL